MSTTNKAGGSVQRVYFALAAFNVGTLLVSLWLGHQLMVVYRESVAVNEQWAAKLANYASIGQLITEADAPGNDVFVDKDVAGQRKNLETTRIAAIEQFARAEVELQQLPAADRDALLPKLQTAKKEFTLMVSEANTIFVEFEAQRMDSAGQHMGQMDQAFARSSAALDGLRSDVQAIQSQLFVNQLAAAARSQSYQYVLMAFVVLMVAAVVAYGFRLQRTFQKKQAEVDRANAGMRRVLDNVDQGLLTLDMKGAVIGERSDAVRVWMGEVKDGELAWDVIGRFDPKAASWLRSGWEMLVDGFMPLDVVLDQLPARARVGQRELAIGYRPIMDGGPQPSSMLLVISDVTAKVASERLEAQQKETLAMFERVMRDRQGFVECFDECGRLVTAVTQLGDRDLTVVKRQLHTLKGNSASVGLITFAATCHELEEYLNESQGDLSKPAADRLMNEWSALSARLHTLMGEKQAMDVVIAPDEYEAILTAVSKDDVPRNNVRSMVEALRLEPAVRRFERLADQAQSVASRLGKGPIHVAIDGGGLRFDRDRWGGFFSSLVHVVRNAIDHGLETPAKRAAVGKSVGELRMRAQLEGSQVKVVVSDDGAGIDLVALVEKAKAKGHAVSDGLEAIFLDGVTSKDEVTDLSGRGVGMAAVKAAVEALEGNVTVQTQPGKGTTFAFTMPAKGVSRGTKPGLRAA
jgi:signal transduction histidine kinase